VTLAAGQAPDFFRSFRNQFWFAELIDESHADLFPADAARATESPW
jgi:hypothetical protein